MFAFIGKLNMEAFVQKGHFTETFGERVVVVHNRVGEDFRVGPEGDHGARMVGVANAVQLLDRFAALKRNFMLAAIAAHNNLETRGKRIHARNANAVQTAGNLIALAAEFTASMKDGENDLDRGDFLFRMLVDRDAAAVVDNRDGIVFVNRDIDFGAIAGKGLVDGVVHNLIHKVVQTTRTRRTDIHAGAHTHGFKALEDLNV